MPKAKKAATSSASSDPAETSAEATVLKYMQTQNRPYSQIDIFNNLHGAVGKALLARVLTSLSEQGQLIAKTYGKQVVYVAPQDNLPAPSNEEIDALDKELAAMKDELAVEKEKHKALQAELGTLQSTMTTEEIRARLEELSTLNEKCQSKLAQLSSGTRKVDPVEKRRVDLEHEAYTKAWRGRKKMCMDALNAITENLPDNPKDFFEQIGIELDPAVSSKQVKSPALNSSRS